VVPRSGSIPMLNTQGAGVFKVAPSFVERREVKGGGR